MLTDDTWRSLGYGWIVRMAGGLPSWFDETPGGLLAIPPPTADDPPGDFIPEGERLAYREPCALAPIEFERIAVVPPLLPAYLAADRATNFDVLWGTVRDHHAFLAARAVDWDAARDRYRPRAVRATSDRDLLAVLRAAIGTLGDGHATIGSPSDRPRRTPGLAEVRGWIASTAVAAPHRSGGGQLVSGWLDRSIGYLGILRMERFAPQDGGVAGAADACTEVALAQAAIDDALAALAGASGLVLDLRGNTGGWDAVALALAAPFMDRRRVVLTKCARSGTGTTDPQPIVVGPARDRRYGGRIVVLVGPLTASAAEVFAVALGAIPGVIRVGATTRGILSDELTKRLPNGWTFTVSNEIYRDATGGCPEIAGITPDIVLADGRETTPDALRNGLDAALAVLHGPIDDAAISHRSVTGGG